MQWLLPNYEAKTGIEPRKRLVASPGHPKRRSVGYVLVSLHTSLTPQTRHLINAARLDVFEREPQVHPALLACDNAVLIPHLGSATVTTRLAMADLAASNLLAALEDRRPPTLLNPQAWEHRTSRG
jgi:phosphoglycerate dehydrogenase-like enzyme